MIKVKVLAYDEHWMAHTVETPDGFVKYVDLFIGGDLSQEIKDNPESLIGKEIEYEREHTFISIANGVKILPDDSVESAT